MTVTITVKCDTCATETQVTGAFEAWEIGYYPLGESHYCKKCVSQIIQDHVYAKSKQGEKKT